MAYSVFRHRLRVHLEGKRGLFKNATLEDEQLVWRNVLRENIFVICKTEMARSITQRTLCGFDTTMKVNTHVYDDLLNQITNKQQEFIRRLLGGNIFPQIKNNMKFDAIVGNPPYQVMDGGAQASATPIYNEFVMTSIKIAPNYLSMIMPARWYAGGKGLDEFRNHMLTDKHISVFHDFLNPEQLFPNTNIRGGLCYFLWDANHNNTQNLTRVVTHSANRIISDTKRTLKTEGTEVFIRNTQAISIIEKVFKKNPERLEKYVSTRKPFGLDTTFAKGDNFRDSSTKINNAVECYGKGWQIGFVKREEIKQHSEWIDIWKLYTSRANNIGTELNDDNLVTVIGKPNTVCTESYLIIGVGLNLTEESSKNLSTYCRTKFARFMHSLAKSSQDATAKTYRFVPLQDFTSKSDIDWTKSVAEIDRQLYAKYNLTDEEIAFIEQMIKPME